MLHNKTIAILAIILASSKCFSSECNAIKDDKSRLQCYDSEVIILNIGNYKPQQANKDNAMHEAIDRELARILIDPLSAINYEVSDAAPCRKLVVHKTAGVDKIGDCACYSVNSKNRMGGYTGDKLGVMSVYPIGSSYSASDFDIPPDVRGCYDSNIVDRPASNIHKHVGK